MAREQGFFLLEALAAGLALLVMSLCLLLYVHSNQARLEDGCRIRAVFLARTQFAAAEAAADMGRLATGEYPWQGKAEDLQGAESRYEVNTEVAVLEPEVYQVSVQVRWQGDGFQGKVDFEREVVSHEKGVP